jgi:NADH-quinone oxidoreductase subunit J
MVVNLVDFVFYSFCSILLLSSFMVVVVENTVYSVLFLVLSFISSSGLLFLLECDFISFLFIVVYVGAIAVLFLFVVMMLDVKTIIIKKNYIKYFPFASVIGFVLFVEIVYIIFDMFTSNPYIGCSESFQFNKYINWYDKVDSILENEAGGQVLYTDYVFQFLIAGNILLLSVIGAVVLTLNMRSEVSLEKKQNSYNQVSRDFNNAVFSKK